MERLWKEGREKTTERRDCSSTYGIFNISAVPNAMSCLKTCITRSKIQLLRNVKGILQVRRLDYIFGLFPNLKILLYISIFEEDDGYQGNLGIIKVSVKNLKKFHNEIKKNKKPHTKMWGIKKKIG